MKAKHILAVLAAASTVAACGDAADDVEGPANSVTWHRDIRPVVETSCASCHVDGGAAPFALEDWADAEEHGLAMALAVAAGDMPPWPMDPTCRDVVDARLLTDDERALFATWQAEGFPQGDPADYVAPVAPAALTVANDPDLTLARTTPYAPDRRKPDDYRCLPYPGVTETDLDVIGTNVVPGDRGVVHHVLLFVVPPASAAQVDVVDAAADGPGYPCVGGAGVPGADLLTGWVPGQVPSVYPEGASFPVAKGSRFVAQIHYNTLGIPQGEPMPEDLTRVQLWTMPAGQTPTHTVKMRPLAQTRLDIPAGAADVRMEKTITSPYAETIIGITPHMHLLGTRIEVGITKWSGGDEACLARIAHWDFNWQQGYRFAPDAYVGVVPGDQLTIRCTYDNSAENQPTVNGVQQSPRDVTWGEGTLDEMCLAYLQTMAPIKAAGALPCDGAAACLASCPDDEPACLVDCLTLSGQGCTGCAIQPLFASCAPRHCPVESIALGGCMQDCDGTVFDCAFGACAAQLDAVSACFMPHLREGACDDDTAECGLEVATPE